MKTIVTHIRPHLDDICAMWLLQRYLSEARDAALDFISTDPRGGEVKDNPDLTYVGVGRGKYDEHKGDVGDCSTSLVFKDLVRLVDFEEDEQKALQKMVDWVLQEDTGHLNTIPWRTFAVPAILDGFFLSHERDSEAQTRFGYELLDALLVMQRNDVKLDAAWETRVEFTSRYGRAAAFSDTIRQMDAYAYVRGVKVVVIVNPDMSFHTIRADADSDVDLSDVFETLKKRDQEADWYFHHSKKMLICGGDHAPYALHSKLTLKDLIAILK